MSNKFKAGDKVYVCEYGSIKEVEVDRVVGNRYHVTGENIHFYLWEPENVYGSVEELLEGLKGKFKRDRPAPKFEVGNHVVVNTGYYVLPATITEVNWINELSKYYYDVKWEFDDCDCCRKGWGEYSIHSTEGMWNILGKIKDENR